MDAVNRRISTSNLNDHDKKKMKLYTVQDMYDGLKCEKDAGKWFHIFCKNRCCDSRKDSSTQIMNHYRLILGTVGRIKQQAWERKEIEVKIRKGFQERNEEQMSPF